MDLNSIIRSENAGKIQLVVSAEDLRDLLDGAMAFAMKTIKERDEPEYYTREELAALLHVSHPTLLKYRQEGKIPEPVKMDDNGRILYDKAEVRKAIESGKVRIRQKYNIRRD